MNLEDKKRELLTSLEQLRIRIQQLQTELAQRQAHEQQHLGALMLIDELLEADSKAERES